MSNAANKDAVGGGSPFRPAHRNTLERLCALRPDLADEVWRQFKTSGYGYPKAEADRLIAEAIEARKPKMHTATSVAERNHQQVSAQLQAKHSQELAELAEQRKREAYAKRWQQIMDHWGQSQRAAADYERRLQAELDPVGWGHWKYDNPRGYRD